MTTASLTTRAPTLDDVPGITAMMNVRGEALHGAPEMSEDELRGWFTLPSMDVERDIRVAVDASGAVVGYADLGDQGGHGTRLWIDLRVDLARSGDGMEALLDVMEARAREKAVPGAAIRAVADAGDGPYRSLLEARRYGVVRSSFRMAVDFVEPPPPAEPPAGVELRLYRPGEEERAVYEVVTEAFRDGRDSMPQPYEEFLHWWTREDVDPSLIWVASAGGELAGACLCRPNAQGDAARGWVETLGVRGPWRRRGLGRALLLTPLGEFHRRGFAGVALSVDAQNVTGAVRLYESVGMRVTRRVDIYERALDA